MVDLKVLRNSGIYTLCNFLLKVMNFILLPLYTMYLTAADYGVTGLMDNFKALMTIICTFNLSSGALRFYFDYRDSVVETGRYVGTLFCFTSLSTLVFGGLICCLQSWIMPILFKGVNFIPTMLVALVGLLFGNLFSIYQILLRAMEEARLFTVTSLAYFASTALLTCLFIIPLDWGADGVLLASATSGIVFTCIALASLRRKGILSLCIDVKMLKSMLAYSIPLIPHSLSTQITVFISSILINGSGSLASVGLYNIASRFGVVADTLQSSVNQAYQPWLFRQLEEHRLGYKEEIRSFTRAVLWICAMIFVAIGLFIQELILGFLNESYANAWPLVPLIIGVYSIKTVYYFYIGVLFYYKSAARFIFVATLSSSVLNVLLSFLLIPSFGMYGSVFADALAMLLRVSLVIVMSRHCEDVGYRVSYFAKVTAAILITLTVGLYFSYTRFMFEINVMNVLWKTVIYLLFISYFCLTHKSVVSQLVEIVRAGLSQK